MYDRSAYYDPCTPVTDAYDAQNAVRSMVEDMIEAAIQQERARIARVIREVQITYTRVASSDPMNPFSVQGPPDVEQIFSDIADAIEG